MQRAGTPGQRSSRLLSAPRGMVSVMEMGQGTLDALRSVLTAANVPVYLKLVVQADRHAV